MAFCGAFIDTVRVIFLLMFDPLKNIVLRCFPKSKKCIKGEIVLLTGAGQGLGKELALKLAEMEPVLVLWDINETCNDVVAAQLRQAGHVVHAYKVDVTDLASVITTANRVKQEVGDVTMLINNAGVFSGESLVDLTENAVRRTFEVNVMAHFWILQQFLPRMMELNKGHVVAVASVAGYVGSPNMTDYCASKHAAIGLMEALYYELQDVKKKNIKLTTVNPVIITTGLIANVKTRFQKLMPLLDAEMAAKRIVNGILKEEQDIFLPKKIEFLLCFMKCFSRRTRHKVMNDYLKYGFDPVSKKSAEDFAVQKV